MGVGELLDELVQPTGGDAGLPALQGHLDCGGQLLDVALGGGGDVDARRPRHLHQVALDLALEVLAALLVGEVPLVVGEDEGTAGLDHHGDDADVLLAQLLGGVDEHDGHLGAVERGLRAQGRVVLVAAGLLGPAADARGVDEPPPAALELDQLVDRVDRGARDAVDHDALRAGQGVEQRGLADVGLAQQGDATRTGVARHARALLRQHGDSGVEQVAGATPVQGGDGVRLAEPERPERLRLELGVGVVGLVGDEQHGLAGLAQNLDDGLVRVGGADLRVDDEQGGVGVVDSSLGLGGDLRGHALDLAVPAAGVDEDEADAVPLRLVGDAVTGHAGDVLGDRLAAADHAVDEGRLAHVGTADDRQHGQARVLATGTHELAELDVDVAELQPSSGQRCLDGNRLVSVVLGDVTLGTRGLVDVHDLGLVALVVECDPLVTHAVRLSPGRGGPRSRSHLARSHRGHVLCVADELPDLLLDRRSRAGPERVTGDVQGHGGREVGVDPGARPRGVGRDATFGPEQHDRHHGDAGHRYKVSHGNGRPGHDHGPLVAQGCKCHVLGLHGRRRRDGDHTCFGHHPLPQRPAHRLVRDHVDRPRGGGVEERAGHDALAAAHHEQRSGRAHVVGSVRPDLVGHAQGGARDVAGVGGPAPGRGLDEGAHSLLRQGGDERADLVDDLVQGQVRRVEHDGVLGLRERRGGATGVLGITFAQRGLRLAHVDDGLAEVGVLRGPASGPHGRVGGDEELEVGIGQDDGRDVAALDDDAGAGCRGGLHLVALDLHEPLAHRGNGAHGAHGTGDLVTADGSGDVDLADVDGRGRRVGAAGDDHVGGSGGDRVRVVDVDPGIEHGPRHGPVHRPRVEVAHAEALGRTAADAGLAGAGGAVDRDDR